MKQIPHSSTVVRRGGAALLLATALFAAVFSYLAAAFDYPEVLDRQSGQVLPALLALGPIGRGVWLLYALIPLLLIPTALAVRELTRAYSPRLTRGGMSLGVLSAAAMTAGLIRWPTLQWSLAGTWTLADPAERLVIAQRFDTANRLLGNALGEFAGELCLNGFFLVAAFAIARATRQRWLMVAGIAASGLGWIAMLRNLTTAVAPVAALNNAVLPLWMLVLGVSMVRAASGTRAS